MDKYRNEVHCACASGGKNQYTVRLETLALKKSSNNQVFEEISKDFEKLLLSDEFKEENERENAVSSWSCNAK